MQDKGKQLVYNISRLIEVLLITTEIKKVHLLNSFSYLITYQEI